MKHPHAHLAQRVAAYLKAMGLNVLIEADRTLATLHGTELRVEVVYEGMARLNVEHGAALLLHRQSVARVRELHRLLWGNEVFRAMAGLERLKLAEAWLVPRAKAKAAVPRLRAGVKQHGTFLVGGPRD